VGVFVVIYLELFWIFFRLSLVSFGGVFGLLPEFQKILVDQHHWLTSDQFMQSFVVGQLVPGPNMAMCALIGYRVAGPLGALSSTVGIYSGPILVMGSSCALYYRHREKLWVQRIERALRPLVLALILSSTLQLIHLQFTGPWILQAAGLAIALPLTLLNWKKKIGPLATIFLTGSLWLLASRLIV
jgi:chromate transporter